MFFLIIINFRKKDLINNNQIVIKYFKIKNESKGYQPISALKVAIF